MKIQKKIRTKFLVNFPIKKHFQTIHVTVHEFTCVNGTKFISVKNLETLKLCECAIQKTKRKYKIHSKNMFAFPAAKKLMYIKKTSKFHCLLKNYQKLSKLLVKRNLSKKKSKFQKILLIVFIERNRRNKIKVVKISRFF